MPAIPEIVKQLAESNLPVLFLDTCDLLHIIRAIPRPDLKGYPAEAVRLRTTLHASPPLCRLVLSDLIPREWQMNLTSARQEPQDRLAQLDKLSAAVHDVCDSLCFPLGAPRITYSTSGIVEHLTDLSRGLLDAAILVEADQACMEKAQARVLANIPPTVKGNQFKDAAILEHYLAICSQLHSIGFGPKVVFCTSNTNDYFEGKSHLHPVLATEFAAISLAYRPNLRAAVAEVLG